MTAPILVVGLTGAGRETLPADLIRRILAADILIGGARHLQQFPDFPGERLTIGRETESIVARARQGWQQEAHVVVLASGDPLWYGIGATLRKALPPEALEIIPAPASFQLAFAALAEPWHDAALLSAHGRALDGVVGRALAAPKAAILTDHRHTPAVVAKALIEAGFTADACCAVCENLGARDQRIVRLALGDLLDHADFAPLNVLVVWNDAPVQPHAPGLPDETFLTHGGQLTKREVRLLSLGELALMANEVLWDIGAGSGSVSIEAARSQPTARVYAVERRAEFCAYIRQNRERLRAFNVNLIEGSAPEACVALPTPNAVFIGGSGGELAHLIEQACTRLQTGGRLVVNLVTLEHLQLVRKCLPDARVTLAQFSRGEPIQESLRLAALNPVFVVAWTKP
jgi:precorrin-6Y C5,15-methyltransferase (decarboxylating)